VSITGNYFHFAIVVSVNRSFKIDFPLDVFIVARAKFRSLSVIFLTFARKQDKLRLPRQ